MFLECKGLSFRYPQGAQDALADVRFRLDGPGFHSLFGPSGVGKTTLARILAGEIQGFSGDVVKENLSRILYSYNLERLPGWSTLGEHLEDITLERGKALRDELIRIFGLEKCLESRFAQLSLGQQNRANLTRYLLQPFDVLIMDESLANVDESTKEHIILNMKGMFPSKCFLYISHNLMEVAKFCRQIVLLRALPKSPQAVSLSGQDYASGRSLDKGALERAMLEVVRAT